MSKGDELAKKHIVYTPLIWASRAQQVVTETLGADWYNQAVWDFSCGERAMTKNSDKFAELYSSDIRPEVEPDFVYDAMKVEEDKLPPRLLDAITSRRPVILFTNVPFGTVGKRVMKAVIEWKTKYNARLIFACFTSGRMIFPRNTGELEWYDHFWFLRGFMCSSREFGLKEEWPVFFSIWIARCEGEEE